MKLVPKQHTEKLSDSGLGSSFFDDWADKIGSAIESGQSGYERGKDWQQRLYYLRHGELPSSNAGFNPPTVTQPNRSRISPWLITGVLATGAAFGVYKLKAK